MKKLLLLFLVPFIICGCTKQKQEEITFSSWGSVSEVKILKKIISDFELENPDIKINFIHIPQNYFQKIHLLFASNTAPDVVFINNLNLPIYENYLEDLSAEINPQEFYSQSINGFTRNNKLLAIPRDVSNLVFYVNLDLTPLPPRNWTLSDLLKISQKVSKNGVYGVSFEEDVYFALPYLQVYGENLLENKTPEEYEGLNFYKNLRDKYHVAPTKSQIGSSTLAQMFLDKKIAFYLSGRWLFPKISEKADFNWTVINFPSPNGVPCDTSGWAISKNSKHKSSAKKFIKYLASEESSSYFMQTGLIVPARIKVAKNIKEKVFLDAVETSIETPVNKDYKKLTDKYRIH